MYSDVLLKIGYFTERIRKEYARAGAWPDNEEVKSRLSQIDSFLSIYRHINMQPGSKLDVVRFNNALKDVGKDLEFLYKLRMKTAIQDIRNTNAYVECHLTELESYAKQLEARTSMERDTTFLGKTVLYKNCIPSYTADDTHNSLALDSFKAPAGTKLALYAYNVGVDDSRISLHLTGDAGEETLSVYSLTRQLLDVPQSGTATQYSYSMDKSISISEKFVLSPSGLTPNSSYTYTTLCGKNKAKFLSPSIIDSELEFDSKQRLSLIKDGSVAFYIFDATYANFDWTGSLTNKNFSGQNIREPKRMQRIYIEGKAGMCLQVVTNGTIYADAVSCHIENKKLYFPRVTPFRDFLIDEQKPGDDVSYSNVYLKVPQDAPAQKITIAVKCLEASYDTI